MIDALWFRAPLSWVEPICAGYVVRYKQDGSVEYIVPQRLRVAGSYDDIVAIRSTELGFVEVSGNPVKFFQGHNLFGTEDVHGLFYAMIERLAELVGVEPSEEDRAAWLRGDIRVSRIDCTAMYELVSLEEVMQWLQAASEVSQVKWRGRGHYQPGTLYFGMVAKGKRAPDWQLKLYAKGREVSLPGHHINPQLPRATELFEWAQNKLRIELTLRTGELKRLGLVNVGAWKDPDHVSRMLLRYLARVEMSEQQMTHITKEDELKPAMMNTLAAWKAGADPRSYMKRPTFYRYRKAILDTCGVDIAARASKSNVVPLVRVLDAKPAVLPAWHRDVLFEPRPRLRLAS